MTQDEFVEKVIGKPWVNRAEGPDDYDCWGVVLDSFRKIDGLELPEVPGYYDKECPTEEAAKAVNMKDFRRSQPCDGAIMIVLDTKGGIKHVGRCLCGGVVHATSQLGVRYSSYKAIIAEYKLTRYYMYAPDNS